MKINYNERKFRAEANDNSGDVDSSTIFYYHQVDSYLWGHYSGGQIKCGVLIGRVSPSGDLAFKYRHIDREGQEKCGECRSRPSFEKGRLHLYEEWVWTHGALGKGKSTLVEI